MEEVTPFFFRICTQRHFLHRDRCPGCEKAISNGRIQALVTMAQTTLVVKYLAKCNGFKIITERSIAATNMFVSEAVKQSCSINKYVAQNAPCFDEVYAAMNNGPTRTPISESASAKLISGI